MALAVRGGWKRRQLLAGELWDGYLRAASGCLLARAGGVGWPVALSRAQDRLWCCDVCDSRAVRWGERLLSAHPTV